MKKNLLLEEVLDIMKFDVILPLTFNIDRGEHTARRAAQGRTTAFESQSSITDYEIIALFKIFRNEIAKYIFKDIIKEKVPFVIDSKKAGFGVAVVPFQLKHNVWTLHITTIRKATSLNPDFNVRPDQICLLDDGKIKIGK